MQWLVGVHVHVCLHKNMYMCCTCMWAQYYTCTLSACLPFLCWRVFNVSQDEGEDDLFPGSEGEGSDTEKEDDLFGESGSGEEEEGSTEEGEEEDESEEEEEEEGEELTGFQAELAARLVMREKREERRGEEHV